MVIIPFTIGYLLDLIIGDPHKLPHPVRAIGLLIKSVENILYRNARFLKFKGLLLLIIVSTATFSICYLLIHYTYFINRYLGHLISTVLIFQILATKSLFTETNKVYKSLKSGNLDEAKMRLSYLVSRDCENMEEEDIVRSTIETISENIVDGVTSPLFYILLGGAPLGMLYKAVNTLDSMVGYKNSRYSDFGFFSAKFDDVFNFIPARLTSVLIIISTFLLKYNYTNAFRILRRDNNKHSSPNSGWAEAPVAGALSINLGGKVSYFGKVHYKPEIGDSLKKPEIADIKKTHLILFTTSIISFVLSAGVILIWKS